MADRPVCRAAPAPLVNRLPTKSLEDLYRTHAGWLRRALSRRLRTSSIDVEDIVQDTYIRASRYSDSEARQHPKALLFRIGLNLAHDQIRRDARMPSNDVEPTADIATDGEQEYLLMLKQTILDLPPDLRNVFLLSRFSSMTNAEIARHLGVSVKTVEYRMRKALVACSDRLAR